MLMIFSVGKRQCVSMSDLNNPFISQHLPKEEANYFHLAWSKKRALFSGYVSSLLSWQVSVLLSYSAGRSVRLRMPCSGSLKITTSIWIHLFFVDMASELLFSPPRLHCSYRIATILLCACNVLATLFLLRSFIHPLFLKPSPFSAQRQEISNSLKGKKDIF